MTKPTKTERGERPDLRRGDRVQDIHIEGTVLSVKPTAEAWMVEVAEDDGGTWSLPSRRVKLIERAQGRGEA